MAIEQFIIRPSTQTLALSDAFNAEVRRISAALTGATTDDAMAMAEARAGGLADKARTLRMSIRGDRAAAKAAKRADDARNAALTLKVAS